MYNQIKHFLCHFSYVASTLYIVFAAISFIDLLAVAVLRNCPRCSRYHMQ